MNRCTDAKEVAVIREHQFAAWRGLGARHVPDFAEIVARYSEEHRQAQARTNLSQSLSAPREAEPLRRA